ncbi:hypothetical protein SAMN05216567_10460 [Variovorax sp. OK605]|nr:hypothetical protein SAMN05216567_10460 [Variovorax sp. OK605]
MRRCSGGLGGFRLRLKGSREIWMRCGSMRCCSGCLWPVRRAMGALSSRLICRRRGLLFGWVILRLLKGFGCRASGCLWMRSLMPCFLALRRRGEMSFFSCLAFRGRVSPRQATHFLLLRQKKVSKEKATLLSASLRFAAGNLRCSRFAGSRRTRCAQTAASPDPRNAPLLGAARRAWGAGTVRAITSLGTNGCRRAAPAAAWGPSVAMACVVSPPLWLRRGAERFADQGPPLFERSEFGWAPAKREHRRLPRSEAQGSQTVGSPFFCLRFFGEAKKSRSPAGARPGPGTKNDCSVQKEGARP